MNRRRLFIPVAVLLVATAIRADDWTTGTYSYNKAGDITAIGTDTFTYDAAGRLLSGTAGAGRKQEYTFDDFGNILTIVTDGNLATRHDLAANPANNRLDRPGSGFNVFAGYDDRGNMTSYLGSYETFTYDGLGVTTTSTSPMGVETFHIYGADDERVGPTLDYMHARYYNPVTGRFLSVDPINDVRAIGRPQAWNRYAYVMNNPLRYTDPTGLLWFKLDGEWRFVKDASVMQVDTFDEDGNLVSSQMLEGVKFGLVFNGTGLTQLREDGTTRTIPAVSGRVSGPGEVHPEQQGDRNRGPIPEGQYSFHRTDIQTMGAGDKALGLFKRGAWPGSAFAWGKQRAFLTPSPGTNTRGRSGFSIHGGAQPGSAGCIDLCDMVSVFFSEIPADAETIPVDVDYSNPFPEP